MGKWKMVRLGDIGQIITGNTPKTSDSGNFDSDDILFFKPGDFYANGITPLLGAESFVSNNAKDKVRILPADSILVTCIGIIGKVGITGQEAICNQQINAILPNEHYVSRYVAYAIMYSRSQLNHIANAAVVPIVNKTQFSNLQIPLPPLPVQQQIADVLDLASTLIEKRKAQIDKLDLLVKSQFIEMFGNPVTNPKGWEVSTVGEEICFEGGAQPDKCYFEFKATDDNIRLVQIRDYKSDENITYIPKEKARRFCGADDIMIGRYGPPVFQILKGIEGAYNVALIKATPIRCNIEYARKFLMQDTLLKYIEGLSQRTAGQTGIDMPKLKAYPFPLPSISLQTKFADFVHRVEAQKSQLQKSLAKLEQNYKSLMQKCFRGEIF